jgi:hypothetical protein
MSITTGDVWQFTTTETTPPIPNPSEWSIVPHVQGSYYHHMVAVEASDESLPVEYSFECTNGEGTSSGWQESPEYIAGPYDGVHYAVYRVRTRVCLLNTGSYSPKYDTNGMLVP